jgi:16S rRNA (cytidine1402-2'-O)-methyltransferase
MAGTLYLVATPIGNLEDITFRAVETLKQVDLIACEDTRHTGKLLNHLGISKKLVSYHEHNEAERSRQLINRLERGENIALVSDAGTPAINDPGYRVVRLAIESAIHVESIPGPSALINALVVSGLPTDSFFFGGFLPSKKTERRHRLDEVSDIPGTLIFYEAPHRLAVSVSDCLEVLGDRPAVIARELTKVHEEAIRGKLSELVTRISSSPVKGEIILLIDRRREPKSARTPLKSLADRVTELESKGVDRRSALKQAAKEFGLTRSAAYRKLQYAKKS